MKIYQTLAAGLLTLAGTMTAQTPQSMTDGVAFKDKHVRFTVITPSMVRLEYNPKGRFTDDKSLIAVNRQYPEVDYNVVESGDNVTITTSDLVLKYKKSKGGFTAGNLEIVSAPGKKSFSWKPGQKQTQNLGGTTRTLDRWDGADLYLKDKDGNWNRTPGEMEPGLLARDGWTLIDDSNNYLFDGNPDWEWVKKRKNDKGAQDWYFMGYGDNYRQALNDFTVLAGDIPMLPRYAFGYWWSRWWAYSEHEFKELVKNFEKYRLPIDVLVIDMDWHYTDEAHGGWTGWTWNEGLFPDHERFLNWLRDRNLKVTLNLHPASGVKKFEASYPEIARANGVDPKTEKDIPWVSSDKTFVKSVLDNILHPMEKEGVSFWWLDWQQDLYDAKLDSLKNVWWLNYAFYSDAEKNRPGRPMVYHRWGGLGNHRYQMGFSGDSYASWATMDFMPRFTAQASNVLYPYWSHDLGGFYMFPGEKRLNPEIYVRSFQFGAYSPMMRSHSTKNAALFKEPWNYDAKTMDLLRKAMGRHYELIPYTYTLARHAHETGEGPVRPMYYEYPDREEAYQFANQYMYGPSMIVAPVTTPVDSTGWTSVKVWLPEGEWYEEATGKLHKGGRVYDCAATIEETPVFVKAGSIIPLHAEEVMNLRANDVPVALAIYPGPDSEFEIYEDNGDDKEYHTSYATTKITTRHDASGLTVNILPREGSYEGMPAVRDYEVRLYGMLPALGAKVEGKSAPTSYDASNLAVVVKVPEFDPAKGVSVRIDLPENAVQADGVLGNMRRFVSAFGPLKQYDARLEVTPDFGSMSTIFEALEYYPDRALTLLDKFRQNQADIEGVVKAQPMNDKARKYIRQSLRLKD